MMKAVSCVVMGVVANVAVIFTLGMSGVSQADEVEVGNPAVASAAETKTAVTKSSEDVAAGKNAYDVIEATTNNVMTVITEAQGYFEEDPERFYREIEDVLGAVVDFDSFARGVMGKYASKRAYMALSTTEEKQAFKQRMSRFSNIFREGLVKTYAKGLLAFNGNRIDVLRPKGKPAESSSITVVQHIQGEAEKPYVVHYKMRLNGDREWKLRNLTIEAINLGQVYRSQFYSAVKLHKGNVDKVIDNWSVDPTASQGGSSRKS